MEDFLDLFADLNEVNAVLGQCQTEYIEVLYDPSGMECPIIGCKGTKFPSKSKFTRHWEERHKMSTTKYICSVHGCNAECRRKSDMRTHIRRIHENNTDTGEFILAKCEVIQRENKGYLDPGLYIFRGTTMNGAAGVQVPQETQGKESSTAGALTDLQEPAPEEKREEVKKRKLTLQEYQAREPPHHHTTGTQTTWCNLPSLCLPNLPETGSTEELHACLMWLCNGMDTLGRARELVKRRLETGNNMELERERNLRRQLEKKNRELESELKKLRERDTLFEE